LNRIPNYLLDFRLSDSARKYVQDAIFDVARGFDVIDATRNKAILRMESNSRTLLNYFKIANLNMMVTRVIDICLHSPLPKHAKLLRKTE
jgi:hypothetical protein